eukprot:COSAG06_NODE_8447_length_2171_cov_12.314672_1_plen_107_part_10
MAPLFCCFVVCCCLALLQLPYARSDCLCYARMVCVCGARPGVRSGCDPRNRSAGSLQAGAEPTLLGSGGVHGLVLKNISVLAAGDASLSALTWSCTPGSLHGAAVEI